MCRILSSAALLAALNVSARADKPAPVGDNPSVPALIKALDDPKPSARWEASEQLRRLGPKAKDAIPALTDLVKRRKSPAYGALAAVAGKDSVPVILEAAQAKEASWDERSSAAEAIWVFADPRAAPLMGKLLDDRPRHHDASAAARYFAKLGGEDSLARLRKCIGTAPADPDDDGLNRTRIAAVKGLAEHKDAASLDVVLKMAESDPSRYVRPAAAAALGLYADARGIPVLVKALELDPTRLEKALGEEATFNDKVKLRNMVVDLHNAAVESLGRIGTDEALAAIHAAGRQGPARRVCVDFWAYSDNPNHFDAFLKLNEARPLEKYDTVKVLYEQMRNLKPRDGTALGRVFAEAMFFKSVTDPAHFGPNVDLTENGKYVVRRDTVFYTGNFTAVRFSRQEFGHRWPIYYSTVLYRRTAGGWKPVGPGIEIVLQF